MCFTHSPYTVSVEKSEGSWTRRTAALSIALGALQLGPILEFYHHSTGQATAHLVAVSVEILVEALLSAMFQLYIVYRATTTMTYCCEINPHEIPPPRAILSGWHPLPTTARSRLQLATPAIPTGGFSFFWEVLFKDRCAHHEALIVVFIFVLTCAHMGSGGPARSLFVHNCT